MIIDCHSSPHAHTHKGSNDQLCPSASVVTTKITTRLREAGKYYEET